MGAVKAVTSTQLQPRANILGIELDRLDMRETIARCEEIIAGRSPSQHLAVSATNIVALHNDPKLREVARSCALVSADGLGVVWASRLLGNPLPERVNAMDLMERLFEVAEEKGYRIFILGATDEVLEVAAARLRKRHPRLVIAGYRNGYYGAAEDDSVIDEIRAAKPDILFAAMPSPKKEYWLAQHRERLGVPLLIGVGGAIDVVAGHARRAPLWVQRSGFEWFYRMVQEPRRLARRFLVGNAKFLYLLAAALIGERRRG
ncbi:MAG: WecB/TagA/CpsF family glycosyltransferase [Actinobacteria bacterium]|nr:WecB/TagA/CpsF family glycosyltransferase [Actinomycetota bacterium]